MLKGFFRGPAIFIAIFLYSRPIVFLVFVGPGAWGRVQQTGPQAKPTLSPVLINKVLLEHNHVYLFTYLWLLSLCNGRHEKLLGLHDSQSI